MCVRVCMRTCVCVGENPCPIFLHNNNGDQSGHFGAFAMWSLDIGHLTQVVYLSDKILMFLNPQSKMPLFSAH